MDAAADLFHEQGVNATSLGDVLRASRTGKGQFYQHFVSREDLVLHVLERHRDLLGQAEPIRSWDDVRAWLDHHLMMQTHHHYRRGCPVGTAAYALQPGQEEERIVLEQIFDRMRDSLAEFFAREQAAERFSADADPRRLACFAVAAVQGAMILGLLDRDPGASAGVVAEVIAHLRSFVVA
jgi:TetR/AcrR family transcriptional repressor of nem operon